MKKHLHKVIMAGLLLAFAAGMILEVMPPGSPAQQAPERRIVEGVDCWIIYACENHQQTAQIKPGACTACAKPLVEAAVPVNDATPQQQ